jgi:Zn-finger nucleic acid-binding protein
LGIKFLKIDHANYDSLILESYDGISSVNLIFHDSLNPKPLMMNATRSESMLEAICNCPVCLGVAMEKLPIDAASNSFTLDRCPQCGGIWFDRGEMHLAAAINSEVLMLNDPLPGSVKPMDDGDGHCVINCQICQTAMHQQTIAEHIVHYCRTCRGTWLDRTAIRSIPTLSQHPLSYGWRSTALPTATAASPESKSSIAIAADVAKDCLRFIVKVLDIVLTYAALK